MRRPMFGLAIVLGVLALAPAQGRAQFIDGTGDPFFLYYGFYLPRQAALAATPRPEMTVNSMAAIRQENALTERAGLYDPISPFGSGAFDPSRPFGDRTAGRRGGGMAGSGTSINGSGPPMYYNRTSSYYPNLRTGRAAYAGGALSSRPAPRPAGRPPVGGIPGF